MRAQQLKSLQSNGNLWGNLLEKHMHEPLLPQANKNKPKHAQYGRTQANNRRSKHT